MITKQEEGSVARAFQNQEVYERNSFSFYWLIKRLSPLETVKISECVCHLIPMAAICLFLASLSMYVDPLDTQRDAHQPFMLPLERMEGKRNRVEALQGPAFYTQTCPRFAPCCCCCR